MLYSTLQDMSPGPLFGFNVYTHRYVETIAAFAIAASKQPSHQGHVYQLLYQPFPFFGPNT